MEVLVDATPLLQRPAGIGRYTREVLNAALAHGDAHRYTLFGIRARPPAPPIEHPDVDVRYVRIPSQLYSAMLRNLGTAPPVDVLTGTHPDLAFFPNYATFRLRRKVPTVTVIHDLSFLHFPHMFTRRARRYLRRVVTDTVRRADVIVTDSEFVKAEVVTTYGVDSARIHAVPLGVDPTVFNPDAAAATGHGLPADYVLHVGTLEPRKNVVGLVAAYRSLPPALKRKHPLAIAGGRGWRDTAVRACLRDAQDAGEPVYTLGHVGDRELAALYAGAVAFALPSLYEGFGLPAIEAMSCGTPVVTSNVASLPEVVGDAAVLVDPRDQSALAGALERVLGDPELRATLGARGIAQARRYTWPATAARLLELFANTQR